MKRVSLMLLLLFVCAITGCPSSNGAMVLGGDAQLVGTWEGIALVQGFQIRHQITFDESGHFLALYTALQDNSTASAGGRWYVGVGDGYLDMKREWLLPDVEGMTGTFKAHYELNGNVLNIWQNPINMDRPSTRESAALHEVLNRKTNKSNEPDNVVGTLFEAF